ncbi:unnamed protein product [Pleuronectes platessa]|uniref:Uncharacterized protein n=1 Tax=Pleuronectes platessa TaxID=8262 RepID=A0A9N7YPD0_PLEPL|nr:unnamed protein product [Pleuronectes platessa]
MSSGLKLQTFRVQDGESSHEHDPELSRPRGTDTGPQPEGSIFYRRSQSIRAAPPEKSNLSTTVHSEATGLPSGSVGEQRSTVNMSSLSQLSQFGRGGGLVVETWTMGREGLWFVSGSTPRRNNKKTNPD